MTSAQTTAWWMWLLVQAGVLLLYAAGTPLSGGYPVPVEVTAPIGLGICQLILGALLARMLFTDAATVSNTVWTGFLFHAIASRLAGLSAVEVVPLVTTVTLWLAIAGLASRWPTARLALLFALIAGPLLLYIRLEYAHASTSPHFWTWAWSPTVGICSTGIHQTPWPTMIVGLALLLAILIGRWIENRSLNARLATDFPR